MGPPATLFLLGRKGSPKKKVSGRPLPIYTNWSTSASLPRTLG